ncbi:hypothetical protein BGZ95_001457 [Linnemannia exigua]|uniref:LysM domain-containing protein n=1 Tax=Linnemannia exigua TaxID=604196 RepID=A0AAD4DLW9_9FUNG|nr:hypothetical protein BGZ95_001457 [Linnemannia exigua]
MKFTLSAVVLALAATSQVAAVVPIPVKECTRSYIVEPGTPGCKAFADKFGITTDNLLAWNTKLRGDCANLDVGEPLCVSITPGECCLRENPHNVHVPQPGEPEQPHVWDPAPYTKGPAGQQPTGTAVVPPVATPVAPGNGTKPATTPAGVKPTTGAVTAPTTSGPAGTVPTVNKSSDAVGSNKGSIVLGVAGLLLSAVYML